MHNVACLQRFVKFSSIVLCLFFIYKCAIFYYLVLGFIEFYCIHIIFGNILSFTELFMSGRNLLDGMYASAWIKWGVFCFFLGGGG